MRTYGLPQRFQISIAGNLQEQGFPVSSPHKLAVAVKKLSDFYIENPAEPTPWQEQWAQAAYLAYYLPLNSARSHAVVDLGLKEKFFEGLDGFVDFGSGLSAFPLLLGDLGLKRGLCVERSRVAIALHQRVLGSTPAGFSLGWESSLERIQNGRSTLAIFSYALTEFSALPNWALNCEAICIVEPSTQDDGRKLMELRAKLMAAGYSIWAPCTHQLSCPLLEKSKKDWCHDRVGFAGPGWYEEMERHLPFKNRTITFSYLLARRKPASEVAGRARLVGDRLVEKGKTRQLVCRGHQREFLSWMHKYGEAPELFRGDLIELPSDLEKKGDELRWPSPKASRLE